MASRKGSTLRELPILVASALILSIIIKTFLIQFFYIPSGSMENTLLVNDRVGVNKFGALFSEVNVEMLWSFVIQQIGYRLRPRKVKA